MRSMVGDLRNWALIKLAGGSSVVLNCTVNIHEGGTEPEFIFVRYAKGRHYFLTEKRLPVLELQGGESLVAGCTFNVVPGKASEALVVTREGQDG